MVSRRSRCSRSQEVRICGRYFSAMTRPSRSRAMRFSTSTPRSRVPAPLVKRVQQLRMGGDPGAAADQFDRRALINVGVPPLLPQEGRGKQAGHRPADDDGATPARRGKRDRHPLNRDEATSRNDTPPARAGEGSLQHHKIPLIRYFVGKREQFLLSGSEKVCSVATFSAFERKPCASVPIPKFASLCRSLVCELRNRGTLATY